MDFILSDEQQQLQASTRSALERLGGLNAARAIVNGSTAEEHALWDLGGSLGWWGLGVPESAGGSGGTIVEQVLVAQELGRVVSPISLVETATLACAVAGSDRTAFWSQLLASVASGEVRPACALAETNGGWEPGRSGTRLVVQGNLSILSGQKTYVSSADAASFFLVTAQTASGPAVAAVDAAAPGLTLAPQATLDLTRRMFRIDFDAVALAPERILGTGAPAEDLQEQIFRSAYVLTAAECVGVAERLLEMTVAYAQQRVQFGRPIGSFQAIKFKLADMAISLSGVRALTYVAAMHVRDYSPDGLKLARMAKGHAGGTIAAIASEALQIHGGIGMTWEHPLHLLLRRSRVLAATFGTAELHRRRIFDSFVPLTSPNSA
jgi:alkylation response protein AidB-like acyl-CoA dehydrogenase